MKKGKAVFEFADFEVVFASIRFAETEEGSESEDDFKAYERENMGKVVKSNNE